MITRIAFRLLTTSLVVVSAVTAASADIRGPEPRIQKNADKAVPMKVSSDPRARVSRLVIPRKFLVDAGVLQSNTQSKSQMIFAGIALSLSAVVVVFLLLRRRSAAVRVSTTAALLIASGLVLTEMASADVPPRILEIPRSWRGISKDKQKVILEVKDKGDAVELILGTYRPSRGNDGRPQPRPSRSSQPKPETSKSKASPPVKQPSADSQANQ